MSRPIIGYIVDAATRLFTSRKIGGVDFDGTKDINLPGVNQPGNQNTSGNAASATRLQTARKIGGVDFNGTEDITLPGVNSMGNQSTSGNAASATRLQTGRRINNTLFNGTSDIITDLWGVGRNITVGGTTRSVDGSENITWTLKDIGVGTVGRLNTNGNLTNFLRGDGTWAPVSTSDTTYTAGSGLTLNGTEFSLPVSVAGTGSFVTGVEQTPTGLRVSLGTPPDTNTTYTEVTEAEITAGTSATLRVVTGRRMKFAVDTFGLKLGTTATTAKPGNWLPSWDDVTGKPAVIAAGTTQAAARQAIGAGTSDLILGTAAGTAAAGNDSRINNGQTAFGWGNHASAGYVKTNTTYAEIPSAEVTAGTAATLRTISARRLKEGVIAHGLKIGTTAATAKAGNWVPSWNNVTSKPATATRWPTFAEVTGKPTTFPPSEHTHTIAQVSGLQDVIDTKVNVSGNQTIGGTKDFNGVLRATGTANATSATSGSLRSSGGLGVALDIFAGGNVTAYSDVRRKKDIVTIDGALDIILKARGVYYTRKDTGVKEVGFIAQEMQKILPRVIGGTEESGLGISYGNITAVLAEAVKTVYNDHVSPAKERITQLEDQNKKLMERLERLETLISNKLLNEE